MKRYFWIFFIVFLLIGGTWYRTSTRPTPQISVVTETPAVTLVFNDSQIIATQSGLQASTAYDALTTYAKEQNIPIVTKQYDFGVFVQKIGQKESGADMAWVYEVNGEQADVAADKYILKSGDRVEWKYTKPTF